MTDTVKTLGRGQFAFTPLTILPGWYLQHLVGGIADVKWESLSDDEKAAVQAELKARVDASGAPLGSSPVEPVSTLESAQETHAKRTIAATGGVGKTPTGETAPASPAGSETTEPPAGTPVLDTMTVGEAKEFIATVATVEELDTLRKAEKAGKARVGVLDAIDARKAELKAAAKEAAKAPA